MALPPLACFLDIPHIANDIFDCLSFADLYNSVFVSRSWHSALIPRLWRDVVTFRPIPPPHPHANTTYTHYFSSPAGRKSLIKHVHHIHALTCRGDALLPVLAKAGICSLVELNFVIEDQQSSASTVTIPRWVQRTAPILDLRALVTLIEMNPRLHSVSVENIDLDKQMECWALEEFVKALDPFPSITCVCLGGKLLYKAQDAKSSLLEILERRLARVTNKVTSLDFGHGSQFTRSRRGLSSLPGAPNGLTYPGGRWENEKHRFKYPWDSLAVLEHHGVMRFCLPYAIYDIAAELVLTNFSELHRLIVNSPWSIPRNVFQVLPIICPNLHEIELLLARLDCDHLGNLLDDRRLQLSSVTLTGLGWKMYMQDYTHFQQRRRFLLPNLSLQRGPARICNRCKSG